MAISVTTNYHTIYPPTQLEEKLIQLAIAGAMAKILEQNKLYNDLKSAYNNLKNQWEDSTRKMCKEKSKTNWLGGGDIYACFPCEDWDSAINPYESAFKDTNREDLIKGLNSSIIKLNRR